MLSNQSKLQFISTKLKNTAIADYLGVSDRYLRYIKEGKRPAKNLTSIINDLYNQTKKLSKPTKKRLQDKTYISSILQKEKKLKSWDLIDTVYGQALYLNYQNLFYKLFNGFIKGFDNLIKKYKSKYNAIMFDFNIEFSILSNNKEKGTIELTLNTSANNLKFNKRVFDYLNINDINKFFKDLKDYLSNKAFIFSKNKKQKSGDFNILWDKAVKINNLNIYLLNVNEKIVKKSYLEEINKKEKELKKQLAKLEKEKEKILKGKVK